MSGIVPGLPDIDDALANDLLEGLAVVEERLKQAVAIEDPMVKWTARHLLDAGGKRVRPVLTLTSAALGSTSGVTDAAIDAAVLVELTHLASLYHDDVMDSAPTRRGARSAHEVWTNSVAILTGDFLFARASALSARLGLRSVELHSATFERLCLGQLHETVGPSADDDEFDHYLSVLADKTASLIALAGELGALHGGADERTCDIMRRYGECVGIAFQLADDVLDLESDASTSGKQPGTDLREGVPTMPTLLLRRRAAGGEPDAVRIMRMLEGDLSSDRALQDVVDALRSDAALVEARQMALARANDAIAILHELPAGPIRDALVTFTRSMVERGR